MDAPHFCWKQLFPNGRFLQVEIRPDGVIQLSEQQAHRPVPADSQETVMVVSRGLLPTTWTTNKVRDPVIDGHPFIGPPSQSVNFRLSLSPMSLEFLGRELTKRPVRSTLIVLPLPE